MAMMTAEFSVKQSSGSPTPSVDGAGNSSRRQTLPSLRGEAASSSAAQTLFEQVAITQAPALTGSAAAAADENQVVVVVVESSDGGNVGGGESKKVPLPKSSSASSSSKPVPDVSSSESVPVPVPVSDVSIAPPQGPVVVSNKHAKPNAYSNNNYNHGHFNRQNHGHFDRQKSIKRGSIGFMRPPPPPLPPPFPMFDIPYPRPVSNQPRDWMHMPQDWNGPPRGSPHQMVPPHTGAPPFFAPQPFGNPMGFGMPPYLYVQPQPMFPVMDRPLTTLILNQIDYYFSETNLVTDKFLKENMDREGWVPIGLIAGFPRMDRLTKTFHLKKEEYIELILNSLRNSKVVEVQGEKLRPRKNWERWVATSANGARQGEPSNSSPVIEDATTKPNTIVGLSDGSPSSETVALSDAIPSSETVGLSDASSSSEQQESTTTTLKLAEDNCNGNRKKV